MKDSAPINKKRKSPLEPQLWAYGLCVLLFALLEWLAVGHYPDGSHVQGQRLAEYNGNAAMGLLLLTLLARPLRLLRVRRALGLSALAFSLVHTRYAFEHVLGDSLEGVLFLTPERQVSTWVGFVALALMIPLALTSSRWAIRKMGAWWKRLHRFNLLATVLAALHTAYMGVHYGLTPPRVTTLALLIGLLGILVARAFKFRLRFKTLEPETSPSKKDISHE